MRINLLLKFTSFVRARRHFYFWTLGWRTYGAFVESESRIKTSPSICRCDSNHSYYREYTTTPPPFTPSFNPPSYSSRNARTCNVNDSRYVTTARKIMTDDGLQYIAVPCFIRVLFPCVFVGWSMKEEGREFANFFTNVTRIELSNEKLLFRIFMQIERFCSDLRRILIDKICLRLITRRNASIVVPRKQSFVLPTEYLTPLSFIFCIFFFIYKGTSKSSLKLRIAVKLRRSLVTARVLEKSWRMKRRKRKRSFARYRRVQHTIFFEPLTRYKRCLLVLTSIHWKGSQEERSEEEEKVPCGSERTS